MKKKEVMGKKKARRAEVSSSDRRSISDEPPPPSTSKLREISSANSSSNRKQIIILICLLIVFPAISVLFYRRIYSSPAAGEAENLPDVYWRELVRADISYHQVLNENMKVSANVSRRQFESPVLAYITPWNSKGYDLAKKFNSKLTHISPVWYDLKSDSEGSSFVLEGRHNADIQWISEVRKAGNAKVLPRVVLEAMPMDLLTKKKLRKRVINLILEECKEFDYDGIVLESWSRWAAYGVMRNPQMRMMALQFIKKLGEAMHSVSTVRTGERLQLVYVIGPPYSDELQPHDFGPEDLSSLSSVVDGFSLMTYDFSNPNSPGPNAPLQWVRSILKLLLGTNDSGKGLAGKIFLGINFYGNDYLHSGEGGGPILGTEYLNLLKQHKPVLQWEKNSAEHFFIYTDNRHMKHVVFYPSLLSIDMRLQEARSWGAGISIWEIGQGLDFFFDIL